MGLRINNFTYFAYLESDRKTQFPSMLRGQLTGLKFLTIEKTKSLFKELDIIKSFLCIREKIVGVRN